MTVELKSDKLRKDNKDNIRTFVPQKVVDFYHGSVGNLVKECQNKLIEDDIKLDSEDVLRYLMSVCVDDIIEDLDWTDDHRGNFKKVKFEITIFMDDLYRLRRAYGLVLSFSSIPRILTGRLHRLFQEWDRTKSRLIEKIKGDMK